MKRREACDFISSLVYKVPGMYEKAIHLDSNHPIQIHWGNLTEPQIHYHANEQEDIILLLSQALEEE